MRSVPHYSTGWDPENTHLLSVFATLPAFGAMKYPLRQRDQGDCESQADHDWSPTPAWAGNRPRFFGREFTLLFMG
jgi:hypothetical protein